MRAPLFRAFHALAIDDGGGRTGVSQVLFATPFIKRMVDAIQGAIIGPQLEIVVDRAFRRQIFRDRAPLVAGRQNVHEAIHHLTHDHRALVSAALAGGIKGSSGSNFLRLVASRVAPSVTSVPRLPQLFKVNFS